MKRFNISRLTLMALALLTLPVTSFAQGLPAEVVQIEATRLQHTIQVIGTLRANESVIIRPEISGRIHRILFDEGQPISAGEALVQLDASAYEAELAQTQARANLSRIEYERAANLLERNVGSENERDNRLAQLRINEAEVELARTRLAKTTIRAPFDGVTGLRMVGPGDFVNAGQDLVELTDFKEMKLDFSIPERNLTDVRTGQSIAVVVDALPGQRFEGEIYAIAPSASSGSHNLRVRARVPNPDLLLRPGLFARIEILIGEDDQALMIPEEAIIPQNREFFVMRMNDENQVSLIPVTLGTRQFGKVQIASGLDAGDVIVTSGHIKLRPGMPITPLFPQPAAEGSNT
ncbi:efflux RND transporter periplasmic adaptor subunit [Nitrincola alkalilacustris]|uniref:efflux RND transporter periplasmic adaptor subunit n=1 Tax=Nitrincola alkalilacustris TaxID=1571224 RepID=UPI00124BEB10|nr:efflux RND transporter periplasmic adaptor subunit [Nitrincola alkalilacustris]